MNRIHQASRRGLLGHPNVAPILLPIPRHRYVDEAGVHQAVKRFFDNGPPYYPRSHTRGGLVDAGWEVFRKQYLYTSERLQQNEEKPLLLPAMFMAKAREKALRRRQKQDAADERSKKLESELAKEKRKEELSVGEGKCPFKCLLSAQTPNCAHWYNEWVNTTIRTATTFPCKDKITIPGEFSNSTPFL